MSGVNRVVGKNGVQPVSINTFEYNACVRKCYLETKDKNGFQKEAHPTNMAQASGLKIRRYYR